VGSTAKKLGESRRTVAGGELVNEEWQVAGVSPYKVYQGCAARQKKLRDSGKNSGRRRNCKCRMTGGRDPYVQSISRVGSTINKLGERRYRCE
jgi:hypothetical protein